MCWGRNTSKKLRSGILNQKSAFLMGNTQGVDMANADANLLKRKEEGKDYL
jgi:hypothetical protein